MSRIRIKYNIEGLKRSQSSNFGKAYQVCSTSVMDTIADPDITFDEKGRSNYFHQYVEYDNQVKCKLSNQTYSYDRIITEIKQSNRNNKYDCIIGISGGVDSTYLCLLAARANLRVLCIHFDNGWNSELAVSNIQGIISHTGFEFYSYVIDWNEFRDIQLAYFKAGVIDLEAVTDIAIFSALNKLARKFNIRTVLDGRNGKTELILPPSWINKDPGNLRNIHSRFGTLPIRKYPLESPLKERAQNFRFQLHNIPLLEYIEYNKEEAKNQIISEFDWRDYGGKHYESVFTRFYQGYILPEKFNVDKRKAHLSNLIFAGQISRQEALKNLESPIYPITQLEDDFPFVIKKLGFTETEFYNYIDSPSQPHSTFGQTLPIEQYYPILKPLKNLYRLIKR